MKKKDSGEDFFASLLGLESRLIDVKGPKLSEGGLYKLDVSIITADGYSQKLETPLVFNAGISITNKQLLMILLIQTLEIKISK